MNQGGTAIFFVEISSLLNKTAKVLLNKDFFAWCRHEYAAIFPQENVRSTNACRIAGARSAEQSVVSRNSTKHHQAYYFYITYITHYY